MRVAYVLPYLQKPTGWRSHSIAFLNAIRQHVQPVLFVARADEGAAYQLFPQDEIYLLPSTQMASLSSLRGAAALWTTYRAVRAGRFPPVDLVHALEAYPAGWVGRWLAHKLDKPYVLTSHGTYGVVWYEQALNRRAYERVLAGAGVVCPVSNGTAELMQRYFEEPLQQTCIRPILNGNTFTQRIPQSTALERVTPEKPVVLSVGDVKARKGQDISLAAFARLQARFPEAEYHIVGRYRPGDPYYELMQEFVKKHRLANVHFLGAVSDAQLRESYGRASVFVLTPRQEGLHFEGFGLVYLEAGAYGLPVVATRSGGVPDAVKDGETGFLVEPEDTAGVASAMERLLTNPQLAEEMGRANRRLAETLTWESNAAEYYQAYQELLAGKLGRKGRQA